MARINPKQITNLHATKIVVLFTEGMALQGAFDLCGTDGGVYAQTETEHSWSKETKAIAERLAVSMERDVARVLSGDPKINKEPTNDR